MTNNDDERTESGSPVYRHEAKERGWQMPEHPAENLEEVEAHVEQHVGKVETVFHEILSDVVHLDILFVPADDDRPYHVLVTSGVSDEPMTVPAGADVPRRVELLMALPADWPLTQESFNDEANYWPIYWLKMVGRLPHLYQTWLGWGHSIPNGDPPEPIANTDFVGVMLAPAYWLPPDFFQLKSRTGDVIAFYQLIPLYREEMDFKLKQGADDLEKLFQKKNIDFILNPRRPNVAKRKGWFSR